MNSSKILHHAWILWTVALVLLAIPSHAQLWVPEASGNGTDALRVLVDGAEVFAAGEGELRYRAGYRRVDIDLSQQADGGNHVLRFEASTSGLSEHSNFLLDDVSLMVCTAVVSDPDISVGSVTVLEGNFGTRDTVFTIQLSAPSQFAHLRRTLLAEPGAPILATSVKAIGEL